ncbi:DUF3575 domain-containing protein [Robiginitalea aurantiaca]|uniref:DUF3575 domain-containing protein n=1 Tax=Robiginitalea aurantiaca TaxID=3056915 RepID=A0ABT7WEA4_9FLAO|nr:DUF3575 domain-containing protein [Robiginitalea aurantiaca]MDM9631251.1 DUF3575 domain-containing protein [Robiginitalea aurantiaca]
MQRKILVFFIFLIMGQTLSLRAQNDTTNDLGVNELKLNAAYLLAGFAEISYERILGEDSALGLSLGFALDNSIDYRFNAIPYYRLYFGKKKAAGFFAEGNGAFFSERTSRSNTALGAGLGLAIGGKFMTKNQWIAELFLGVGRNFVNNDLLNDVYPRAGISIGKRF